MAKSISLYRAVKNPELLEALLLYGADVRGAENGQKSLVTRLFRKYYHRMRFDRFQKSLRILVSNGARLNGEFEEGKTPLHFAVRCPELLEFLVKNGADVQGAETEERSLCESLWRFFGRIPLERIEKSFGILLSSGARLSFCMRNSKGEEMASTPLHYAVLRPELLEIFIKNGADIKAAEQDSRISLIATLSHHYLGMPSEKFQKSLEILLSNGARLDVGIDDEMPMS
eukprot:g349.t1